MLVGLMMMTPCGLCLLQAFEDVAFLNFDISNESMPKFLGLKYESFENSDALLLI